MADRARFLVLLLAMAIMAGLAAWLMRGTSGDNARGDGVAVLAEHGSPGDAATFSAPDVELPDTQALTGTTDLATVPDPAGASPPAATLVARSTWLSDGSPAAGLGLLASFGDEADPQRATVRGVTDDAGLWRLDGAPVGRVTVRGDRQGLVQGELRGGETTELLLALPDGVLVQGTVIDAELRPVAGADVSLYEHMRSRREPWVVARTDDAGRFEVRGVNTGRRVGATAPGHGPSGLAKVRDDGTHVQQVHLRLGPPGGTLAVLVLDASRTPVPGAQVLLGSQWGFDVPWPNEWDSRERLPPRRMVTDAEGRFRAVDLPPGIVSFTVRASGWTPWDTAIDLLAGETQEFEIVLAPGASIEGVVSDSRGRPVAGAQVEVGDEGTLEQVVATSGEDGRYLLADVPRFEREVRASLKDMGKASTKLVIEPGQRHEWNPRLVAGVELAGRVVDAGGAPASGWRVTASCLAAGGGYGYRSAETDAQGRFRLLDCVDGLHELRVAALVSVKDVLPSAGEVEIRLPAEAQPSAFVEGTVVLPDGRPARGASVLLGDVAVGLGQSSVVDPDTGRFRHGPVKPGLYRIVVKAEGHADLQGADLELLAGETRDVGVLMLAVPSRVRVTLEVPPGEETCRIDCSIRAMPSDRRLHRFSMLDDACRVRETEPLPPGEYELVVTGGSMLRRDLRVRVESGRDTKLTVALEPGQMQMYVLRTTRDPPPPGELVVVDAAGTLRQSREAYWSAADAGETGQVIYGGFTCRPGPHVLRLVADGQVLFERALNVGVAGDGLAPPFEFTLD